MTNLLKKEVKLAASPLSYLFIAFALIAFVPGYPILVGAFFCCLGLFQSFQSAREANDITYTVLLPLGKGDAVRAKYVFCIFIEMLYFLITTAVTLIRMTMLADTPVYRTNALMPANLVYLGFVLLIFGCFNGIFVRGFFKTAYKFGKPFVTFIIVAFVIIGIAETLVHIPFFTALRVLDFQHLGTQVSCFSLGCGAFALLTALSMRKAIKNFEKIDL